VRCAQDNGGGAAVMTRDNDSHTSGAFARLLALHVPFVCTCSALPARKMPLFARCLACLSWHACVVSAQAIRARVPCLRLYVLSLCLRMCFVLHLVDILNYSEFPDPIHRFSLSE